MDLTVLPAQMDVFVKISGKDRMLYSFYFIAHFIGVVIGSVGTKVILSDAAKKVYVKGLVTGMRVRDGVSDCPPLFSTSLS